jgi:2-keto-4-pentenoate hydratase
MAIALAAHELMARRTAGAAGERLTDAIRVTDIEQALAVQAAASQLWCSQNNDRIGAWKAGLPGPGRLVIAPIFASTIQTATVVSVWPTRSPRASEPVARIEPEVAFVLGEDLPPRPQPYTPEEVRAAISQVRLALELIGGRHERPEDCSFAEKLADSLENQGLFLGDEIDASLAFAARELSIGFTDNRGTQMLAGKHPAGDPAAPVYWLADYLRSRGEGLRAGQVVITGCYTQVLDIAFGETVSLCYRTADASVTLGQIDVQFQPRKG